MKTFFLASTLFLTDFANVIATGLDKLDWHQEHKKVNSEVFSTEVPESSPLLFRDSQGMQAQDPFIPSKMILFTSPYRGAHEEAHARGMGSQSAETGRQKAIDIASINFLVPKEKSIRYEKGALVWEVKL